MLKILVENWDKIVWPTGSLLVLRFGWQMGKEVISPRVKEFFFGF